MRNLSQLLNHIFFSLNYCWCSTTEWQSHSPAAPSASAHTQTEPFLVVCDVQLRGYGLQHLKIFHTLIKNICHTASSITWVTGELSSAGTSPGATLLLPLTGLTGTSFPLLFWSNLATPSHCRILSSSSKYLE